MMIRLNELFRETTLVKWTFSPRRLLRWMCIFWVNTIGLVWNIYVFELLINDTNPGVLRDIAHVWNLYFFLLTFLNYWNMFGGSKQYKDSETFRWFGYLLILCSAIWYVLNSL